MSGLKKNKTLQAIVEIAGTISPTLSKSLNEAGNLLGNIDMKTLAIGTAAAVATGAVIKLGSEAVDHAKGFQKEMSNVATLLDGDVTGRIAELGEGILEVSDKTGQVTSDLTDGMYQVISAFGDNEDSLKSLEIASKSAKAGNASTTESINLLSAVTKGYGDISADAQQKAADLAFQTVKLGQTSFPELAASMGKVIPLAQTMGVAQEELFGATATLTGVTGNTAEVMTQLRGTVQGFLQPTKAMASAIEDLGYADGKTLIESEGLQGALNLLKDSVGGNEIAFSELFGSVEAKGAVLALVGSQAENFTEKTKSMYEASGAADKAFEAQTSNLESVEERIKNLGSNFLTKVGMKMLPKIEEIALNMLPLIESALDNLGSALDYIGPALESVGTDLLPAIIPPVEKIIKGLSSLVKWIDSTDGAFEIIIVTLGVVTALIIAFKIQQALLTTGTTLWAAVTGVATGATTALSTALAFLTSPISLAIIAIGAVIAIGILLYKNWDTISAKALEHFPWLGDLISEVGDRIGTVIGGIKDVFSGLIDFVVGVFTGDWEKALGGVTKVFKGMASGLGAIFKAPMDFIRGVLNAFIGGINKIKIPDWVPGIGGKGITIPLIPEFNAKALEDASIAAATTKASTMKTSSISMYASGGFTDGLSIAGEAGTEAVISFDAAHRKENIGYWEKAGRLLGIVGKGITIPLISGFNAKALEDASIAAATTKASTMKTNSISMYASGGFTDGLSIAGEAGTEAVISFDAAHRKENIGYWARAGKLLGINDFSLSEMAQGSNVTIYDFSNFKWSPVIKVDGNMDGDDLLIKLKNHEAEFFDWLEEWLRTKGAGNFAKSSIIY